MSAHLVQSGLALGITLVCALVLPSSTHAHGGSRSSSSWLATEDGRVEVRVSVAARELTRLAVGARPGIELNSVAIAEAESQIHAFSGSERCATALPTRASDSAGQVAVLLNFDCGSAGLTAAENSFLQNAGVQHLHLARLRSPGASTFEWLVSSQGQRTELPSHQTGQAHSTQKSAFGQFLFFGMEHIARGWDHLAFLAALLLCYPQLKRVALLISGFTIGHAITICAVLLGGVQAHRGAVESLVALSILFVAANALPQRKRFAIEPAIAAALAVAFSLALASGELRVASALVAGAALSWCALRIENNATSSGSRSFATPVLTVLFGFIHGLGFASALRDLVGPIRTTDGSLTKLLAFNVGVEVAQLGAVVLALTIGRIAVHWAPERGANVSLVISVTLIALATFWLLLRASGVEAG